MTKPWSGALQSHVQGWTTRIGKYWPQFAYHFTGVRNAAAILQTGALLSRNEAIRRGLMVQDNAAASVIAGTAPSHLDFARLYFRPRTPTQFHNEGFVPAHERTQLHAHCAVPVFFLFDFVSVAALDEAQFSTGNLGSATSQLGSSQEFFEALPFADIFSTGGMAGRQRELTNRRAAEVVVPTALPLEPNLRAVVCRSIAERQTLVHLMPVELRQRWDRWIRAANDTQLFERRGVYIESVSAIEELLSVRFNPVVRGPFTLEVMLRIDGRTAFVHRDAAWSSSPLTLMIPNATDKVAEVTISLDGELAFVGLVHFETLPF